MTHNDVNDAIVPANNIIVPKSKLAIPKRIILTPIQRPLETLLFVAAATVPTLIGAGGQAFAQQTDTNPYAKPPISRPAKADSTQAAQEKKLGLLWDYTLAGGLETSPTRDTLWEYGDFTLGIDDTRLMLRLMNQDGKIDVMGGGEELDFTSHGALFEGGFYPSGTDSKLQTYVMGVFGLQLNEFDGNIALDQDVTLYGLRVGFADTESDTRALLSMINGKGDHHYELLSGFSDSGNYKSQLWTLNFATKLNGKRKAGATQEASLNPYGEFKPGDFAQIAPVAAQGYENSLFFFADAYLNSEQFGGLQEGSGFGIRTGLEYMIDDKRTIGGFLSFERIQTEGAGISERQTELDKIRAGVYARWDINEHVGLSVFGGYEHNGLDYDDPNLGSGHDNEGGAFIGLGVTITGGNSKK